MKKILTGIAIFAGTLLVIAAVPVGVLFHRRQKEDVVLRAARVRVHALVRVGQDIGEAQKILKNNGYRLVYDKPIRPTKARDYMSQLVIIGDTMPTRDDTFFYVLGRPNPFREQSPYVAIDADTDGVIMSIE